VMDVKTPGFPITTGLHLNTNAGLQSDTENRPRRSDTDDRGDPDDRQSVTPNAELTHDREPT
jgi:hypothetical protein